MLVLKSRGGGGAEEIDVPSVDMFVNNMNVRIPYKLFINGQFVDSVAGNTFETINPNDESVICNVQEARKEDVDKAVQGKICTFKGGGTGADRIMMCLCVRLLDI